MIGKPQIVYRVEGNQEDIIKISAVPLDDNQFKNRNELIDYALEYLYKQYYGKPFNLFLNQYLDAPSLVITVQR
jgi:hypothetical protein